MGKPSHKEWMEWAQVILDRLTTCVHVYSRPPYDDIFILEKDRQDKNDRTLSLLRRINDLIDESETPTESLAEVYHHDERVIAGLVVLIQETLSMMPELSSDMQKLLKSEWYDKCNGRLASELFRGPMGDLNRGIGSGYSEQGRLPEILTMLLEREITGDRRNPRKELHRHDASRDHLAIEDIVPKRHTPVMKRRYSDSSGAV